jgi:hypothetical protein
MMPSRKTIDYEVGDRVLHDPGRNKAESKFARVPGLPGRLGGRNDEPISDLSARGKDETSPDGLGCIYVHGDSASLAAEIEYHVRQQTGTTAGAGKRLRGAKMGTAAGLPIGEPRHGEIMDAETEPVEGMTPRGVPAKRKLQATE